MAEDPESAGDVEETGPAPLMRLAAARLPLLLTALAAVLASVYFKVPPLLSLAAFLLIALATAMAPRQPRNGRRFSGGARPRILWPDTGMKAVAQSLPHPTFILDTGGIVRFANAAASQAFAQARAGDALSMTIRSPRLREALRLAAAGQETTFEFRERSGAELVYVVSVRHVHHAAASGPFILVLFEDVTERQAIARMRADFVANASHELRTPLAAVSAIIDTLRGAAKDDPVAQDRFLAIMHEQAERMRRLLDDLLSLSRLEMRAHQRPSTQVDLGQVLRRVVDGMKPLAADLGVAISLDAEGEPLMVLGDEDELHQVFENLIENGLKYGSSGERLEVAMKRIPSAAGGLVVASVTDFGPGISKEHLPRLTERFYRVDVASSREKQGTGLGLAIVKHILTRHRARLDIDSTLGRGATFRVSLAAAEAGPEAQPPSGGQVGAQEPAEV
ncbi:ATP-binding protein [Afifella sp. IM 167]|uniref:ATP-binding protein n=1 Tax=Afifella sp. IM 167 TaxID=2033586 RepID=UPI001CCE30E0|nr:ATP-binding protein [Afifella sp. IM 167]